jgi:hypothetical protein
MGSANSEASHLEKIMTEYNQGAKDYKDGTNGRTNPSEEYLRGWFDAMDTEAGFSI